MKRLALLSIVILLIGLLPTGLQPTAFSSDCTASLTPGADIQAAIDAASAGDVICLQAGTYSPSSTINVYQSVTIQGPQAGIDPRPSVGSTRTPGSSYEAIVDGGSSLSNIFYIYADDVILDGLEVRNGTGDLITSPDSTMQSRPTVRYSIVHGSSGDEGIQLKGVTDAMLEYNHVFATTGDGINIGYSSSGGTIRQNEVHDISSPDGAIYVYQTPNVTIECNLVYDVYNNDGIKLGSKNGGDASLPGGSILYNTVYNTAQDGVAVYMSDTLVEGNEIHHSSSENGAVYLAWGISNVTITLNDVHDNTLNTGKWGNPGAIMIGTAVDAATVFVSGNNIYGNSPNGLTNKAVALLNATGNWWGAADGPSPTGSGDAVSTNVDFGSWLQEPVTILNPCVPADDEGPITYDVAADPNPVAVNGSTNVSATVDDTETGGSDIASAEYSLDGGAWTEMDAQDGDFDNVSEGVEAAFSAPGEAGIYDLCARGTDAVGNTGPAGCIMLVVYDPDGGFVTGGGWIDSPPGAYKLDEYPSELLFLDTFDADPPLAESPSDGVWYPDRYPPSIFESAAYDGDNRLHVHISADDYLPYGGTFYNYQGRKYNLWTPLNTYITADLYIGPDWEGNQRHASLWATTYDADNIVSGYPILGFTAGTGFRIFTQDTDQDTSNGYQAGWHDIGFPEGFAHGAWYEFQAALTESSYRYYIDDELVWIDIATYDSVLWANMMLQAYNYGEDYDVYWDNVGAGVMGPVGKATFGFVSKYKKGTDIPTGNTEFVFQDADLNFHSSSYDWLVVTGNDYAKFKGSGTINSLQAPNGQDYRFMLWAGDGTGIDGVDTFRIKIWWEEGDTEHVVYDNGMDQEIDGGNIVVHTKK